MSKFQTAKKLLKEERGEFAASILINFFRWLPDKLYLKLLYRFKMGKNLNLKNPQRYNEKLQWLKIYFRDNRLTKLVDKIEVKNEVAKIIGERYVIPTIDVYERVDDIKFDKLPNEFVLKTNVGGGGSGVILCRNKNGLNLEAIKLILQKSLVNSIYDKYREWPYKNVTPRIICEKLINPKEGTNLNDYKIYCFNGVPKIVMIASDRFSDLHFDYYDTNFNKLELEQGGPNSNINHPKPENFDQMLYIASRLSEGLPHVRVDLYNVDGEIFFGEMTFFDSSGFAPFNPDKWDYVWGDWITLPHKKI